MLRNLSTGIEASATGESLNSGDVAVHPAARHRLNIVIGHLGRPYSTHTAPMPVLTGSVHAHILTKPSRAGFAVIRLEFIEPGAATSVYQAKACSPTDQPVRKLKDCLSINMTMKTFFAFMKTFSALTYHIM